MITSIMYNEPNTERTIINKTDYYTVMKTDYWLCNLVTNKRTILCIMVKFSML